MEEIWKSSLRNSIAGFASINYRLSPLPSTSDNPSSPKDPSRNVHYPSHLQDVGHALLYLDKEYRIANRYLLVGHSAGATMALELHSSFPQKHIPIPAAILGISGIYHFEAFIEAHSSIPIYREFMEAAFPNKAQWENAAPATNHEPDPIWEQVKAIIISHSQEDELVEEKQASHMLERCRLSPLAKEKVHFLAASGRHDEIWESGHILADLVTKSVNILKAS